MGEGGAVAGDRVAELTRILAFRMGKSLLTREFREYRDKGAQAIYTS